MRARRVRCGWLVSIACVAAHARAGVDQEYRVGGVSARIVYPWPAALCRGYAPLFVQLGNPGEGESTVALSAHSGVGASYDVDKIARVGAHETVLVELALPLDPSLAIGVPPYSLRISSDAAEQLVNTAAGESQPPLTRHVLWLSATGAPRQVLESLSDALSDGEARGGKARVHAIGLEFLPRRWEAYSSVDAVVVAASALPQGDHLDALLAWVRSGGLLVLQGGAAHAAIAAQAQVEPWTEARFVTHLDRLDVQSYFFGQIATVEAEDLKADWVRAALRGVLAEAHALVPQATGRSPVPAIPGLGQLPYRTFAFLLCLFVLAIGPVNMHVLKRLQRPALLLLTVPVIALVTSLLLLAYGILYQGLDVKTASDSITVLDQRLHRATTHELRALFAGMAPAAGLRPGAGTTCFPIVDLAEHDADHYRIDASDGLLLSHDFLPARRTVEQALASDDTTRLRVRLRRDGERVLGENALGVPIRQLFARDAKGGAYAYRDAGAPWEPGRTVELVPVAADRGPPLAGSRHASWLDALAQTPATYIAVLEHSPFTDPCGIECHERWGTHRLIGILDLDEGAWQ